MRARSGRSRPPPRASGRSRCPPPCRTWRLSAGEWALARKRMPRRAPSMRTTGIGSFGRFLAVGERGSEAERFSNLVGDGERFFAVSVRAKAHAIQPFTRRYLYGLVIPGKFPLGVVAEAIGPFAAREGAQLQPESGRFLDDHRRLDGDLRHRRRRGSGLGAGPRRFENTLDVDEPA